MVEQVGVVLLHRREYPELPVRVRNGGDDGYEAEGRVEAGFLESVPAQRSGGGVGPERQLFPEERRNRLALAPPVERHRKVVEQHVDADGGAEREQQPFRDQLSCRIEYRQDEQARGVVGDGEQQEEPDGGMARPEYQASDKVRERDVGRGRDGPAVRDRVVNVGPQHQRHAQIDGDWADHAAGRGDQGRQSLAAAQGAMLQDHGFPDLLRGDREEEGHQDVVDQVMDRQIPVELAVLAGMHRSDKAVLQQRELDERMVAVRVDVGPDKRDRGSRDEQDRVFGNEVPDSAHGSHVRGVFGHGLRCS